VTPQMGRIQALEDDPRAMNPNRQDRLAVGRDLAHIQRHMEHVRNPPHTCGLAVFAREELGLAATLGFK
jgi:hypothetical protein